MKKDQTEHNYQNRDYIEHKKKKSYIKQNQQKYGQKII